MEHNNRNIRYNREHHAQQSSLQDNLLDIFLRDTHGSSPKILRLIEESNETLKSKSNVIISPEVIELLEADLTDSVMSDDSVDSVASRVF